MTFADRDAVDIEQGSSFAPQFDAAGLIPAIAQDAATGEVLMLAWMNADAFAQTLKTGRATYWSRSRAALWVKGETSGHVQTVKEVRIDCDQDAVLLIVEQQGSACHTGAGSCFYRRVGDDGALERSDD
ncbi:MAG: phosphoribosyl-AMP cyclohydrolase [Pseudomonadota bacterium]